MKKAQNAREYLLVVVIVVLVAAVIFTLMLSLPEIQDTNKQKDSELYWENAQYVSIKDSVLSRQNGYSLQIELNNKEPIKLTNFYVGTDTVLYEAVLLVPGTPIALTGIQEKERCLPGETYELPIRIEFEDKNKVPYVFTGEGQKLVAQCQP